MIITTLVLEASSVLPTPTVPGELAEKSCVCSFVSQCVAKDSSFSCVASPSLLQVRDTD